MDAKNYKFVVAFFMMRVVKLHGTSIDIGLKCIIGIGQRRQHKGALLAVDIFHNALACRAALDEAEPLAFQFRVFEQLGPTCLQSMDQAVKAPCGHERFDPR